MNEDLESMVYKAVREKVWEKVEDLAKEQQFRDLIGKAVKDNLESEEIDFLITDVLRESEGWKEAIDEEAIEVVKKHIRKD